MIYSDIQNQLQLLIKTSAPPLLEVVKGPVEEPEWVPGQRVTAFVLTAQPNGRFAVQVGDHVLDMNLPRNTQPGENLELTFVSNQPRLTFVLSRDLPTADAGAQSGAKAPVTLSDTARFLGALLQKASEGQTGEEVSRLARTAPLVSAPPADVKEFANILRSALSQSGLFYESHQAQWMNGQRPLADLLQEPQGKLSSALQAPGVSEGAKQGAIPSLASTPAETNKLATHAAIPSPVGAPTESNRPATQAAMPSAADTPVAENAKSAVLGTSGAPIGAPSDTVPTLHPAHPDTMPLVQQQLHALDAGQLIWRGEVWQGQNMEWTVEERPAREGGQEEAPAWQTSLHLKLPKLGDVSATLAFIPQGLRISLRVKEAGTGHLMKNTQGQLCQALEAAGLPVLGMTVEKNEAA